MEKSVQVENNEDSIEKSRSVEKNKIQNETITTELHFELLKQYAWLSSAIIGAVVILIQLKVLTFGSKVYIPLGCFCFSILNSLIAQDYIVESLTKGKTIYDISKKVYILRNFSIFGLGVGVGLLANSFI
ncbi:hypothetical protein R0K04_01265 [Pseudoalteromonas sp. SIMBA_153]